MHLSVGSIPVTDPMPILAKLSERIPAPQPISKALMGLSTSFSLVIGFSEIN